MTETAAFVAAAQRGGKGRQFFWIAAFLGPALLYATIFMVLPYLNLLQYSFWRVENYAVVPDMTLANFRRIFDNALYSRVILNSLRIAAIVTFFSVVFGYALAFYIAFFAGRSRTVLYFLVVVPLWTSFLLRAFIWRIILGREGIVNSGLIYFGLTSEPLSLILFNNFSMAVALVYVFIPFVVLPVYAALEKIPGEYVEASMDLGASPAETFRRVILPLSVPGVLAGAIFTFCLSFGDFVTPSLLGGPSGIMISSVIINQFGAAFDWPFGSALAALVVVVILLAVTAFAWVEKRYDV